MVTPSMARIRTMRKKIFLINLLLPRHHNRRLENPSPSERESLAAIVESRIPRPTILSIEK
jgi:hypothetical protein